MLPCATSKCAQLLWGLFFELLTHTYYKVYICMSLMLPCALFYHCWYCLNAAFWLWLMLNQFVLYVKISSNINKPFVCNSFLALFLLNELVDLLVTIYIYLVCFLWICRLVSSIYRVSCCSPFQLPQDWRDSWYHNWVLWLKYAYVSVFLVKYVKMGIRSITLLERLHTNN